MAEFEDAVRAKFGVGADPVGGLEPAPVVRQVCSNSGPPGAKPGRIIGVPDRW
jgi:hypothetical protein